MSKSFQRLCLCCALALLCLVSMTIQNNSKNRQFLTKKTFMFLRKLLASTSHKELFPLDQRDYIGTVFVIIGLIIAASGGIGGGGILVPLLILIFNFSPKYAVPLSNFTIFGGSITNTILNLQKRHPNIDRPLVDWNIITIMLPITLAGALLGTFLGRLIPEIILVVSLVALLGYTAQRTLEKGISQFKKESATRDKDKVNPNSVREADRVKDERTSLLSGDPDDEDDEDEDLERDNRRQPPKAPGVAKAVLAPTPKASPIASPGRPSEGAKKPPDEDPFIAAADVVEERALVVSSFSSGGVEGHIGEVEVKNTIDVQREALLEVERDIPRNKVSVVVGMFAVVIVLNLLKGGSGGYVSPIGVRCGTTAYWILTGAIFFWIIGVSLAMRSQLLTEWRLKSLVRYKYQEGDVIWDPRNTTIYPLFCIFAGMCAGMFGIGGGIVFGPMMLEMGVNPLVASSTSAVMIFFTSITASTSYIAFGTLQYDYGIYLFIIGLVATAVGQIGVGYLVEKYKRVSLISLSIGLVVAISAVLMGVEGLIHVLSEPEAVLGDEDLSICGTDLIED